ncbi:MAG TPA: AI-2E family transporter [Chitinophagaceae bacterium]|jgi:predicted PurR-regulated permease PerM|nr:AI-2E family transporter [Chitinophagaceae bacterium]
MNKTSLPFYAKLSFNLISLALIATLTYLGADILMPICFAIVLSMLLLPAVNWLNKRGVPSVLAMILSLLTALLVVGGVLYFLSSQVAHFMDDLPSIKQKFNQHLQTVEKWISKEMNISRREQRSAVSSATNNITQSGGGGLGIFFMGLANTLITVVLLPIYGFLILYYRKLIHKFLLDVFASAHQPLVEEVLEESKTIVQGYMLGLLIEMAIVTALNAGGFLLIGIQYAFFLAVLSAVLNLIPYIGMIIATVICMAVTLTTSTNLSDILWVGAVLLVVQFIDNNFIMPYVVSSKVRINALVSIIGVLIGGALAGLSGMFLSIPGLAVLKAIFDRVDELKPWGGLLGDDLSILKKQPKRRRIKQER